MSVPPYFAQNSGPFESALSKSPFLNCAVMAFSGVDVAVAVADAGVPDGTAVVAFAGVVVVKVGGDGGVGGAGGGPVSVTASTRNDAPADRAWKVNVAPEVDAFMTNVSPTVVHASSRASTVNWNICSESRRNVMSTVTELLAERRAVLSS